MRWLTASRLKDFNSNSHALCGGYKCTAEHRYKGTPTEDADLIVFTGPLDVTPLKKPKDQLWTFQYHEPQRSNRRCDPKVWDGLFNYSITYVRSSDSNRYDLNYGTRAVKRNLKLKRNYYKEKLKMTNRKANALWFVSNCRPWVHSQRMEHALNLSQYMNVEVHTGAKMCQTELKSIFTSNGGTQVSYNQYWFYLAYENSLCRDYITEKFWKIVTSDSLTIPVVLGGYSVEDYEIVAPPNSYIDVRNFTSAKHLAEHLKYVAENEDAFNYYQRWRNEYRIPSYDQPICNYPDCYPVEIFVGRRHCSSLQ